MGSYTMVDAEKWLFTLVAKRFAFSIKEGDVDSPVGKIFGSRSGMANFYHIKSLFKKFATHLGVIYRKRDVPQFSHFILPI